MFRAFLPRNPIITPLGWTYLTPHAPCLREAGKSRTTINRCVAGGTMKVSLLVLATLFLALPRVYPDSVTLNTGEVVQGDILSETETQLEMRVVNYNRTITSRRTILISDIAKIDRETPRQKEERRAYEALEDRFRLDPNREWSKPQYESGIEAFNNYLKTYPDSKFVGDVQKRLSLWKDELSHVEQGEVKFANQWMTPEEKKLKLLEKQLADLDKQRNSAAATIAAAEGKLPGLQAKLNSLTDRQEPVYETQLVGPGHYSQSRFVGYKTVPNPDRPKVHAEIISCQQTISSGRAALASLETKIRDAKSELGEAQQAHEAALAKSNQPPVVAAADQPEAAPPPEPPPPPPPKPWIAQHWIGLAIGAGAFLVVIGVLKYVLGMSARAEAEREENRRAARLELKTAFDRIFADGERPAGENTPEGEIVPIGRGEDDSGGGRWFVIGEEYIWAVQNNGRDGDQWEYNNVVTKGRGAIGARIASDTEWADYIRSTANAAR
jgi:hypothetical protein